MFLDIVERLSHRKWRQIVRYERRRRKRQKAAQDRDQRLQEEQAELLADPSYLAEVRRQEALDDEAQRQAEALAAQARLEWQLRDAALHSNFLKEKAKKEELVKQEALIKKEWEEKQRKEKEEREQREERQDAMLQSAVDSLGQGDGGGAWHNPEPPPAHSAAATQQHCPFFVKTGVCRFGIQCSRAHAYPEVSCTLVLPNMYAHFGLHHSAHDTFDSDVALEYSESENYQHFKDFFEDTLPEFQRYGNVVQFKVCCNTSGHLRGNVYVQYDAEEDAARARTVFNGRWYAGKQLACLYVTIDRWKQALCGLFWRKKCPKGGQCNFLHAFRNPGNAFWKADQDLHAAGVNRNGHSSRDTHRDYEWSRSPESTRSKRRRSTRARSRSRSRDGSRSTRARSRSRSRDGSRSTKNISASKLGRSKLQYNSRSKSRDDG